MKKKQVTSQVLPIFCAQNEKKPDSISKLDSRSGHVAKVTEINCDSCT